MPARQNVNKFSNSNHFPDSSSLFYSLTLCFTRFFICDYDTPGSVSKLSKTFVICSLVPSRFLKVELDQLKLSLFPRFFVDNYRLLTTLSLARLISFYFRAFELMSVISQIIKHRWSDWKLSHIAEFVNILTERAGWQVTAEQTPSYPPKKSKHPVTSHPSLTICVLLSVASREAVYERRKRGGGCSVYKCVILT